MGRKYKNKRKYKGVSQQSETTLRISFQYPKGKQQFESLDYDPNKEESWQLAFDLVTQIKTEIRTGTFDYMRWFPKSETAKHFAPTGGAFLKDYLPYFNDVRKEGIQKLGRKPLAESSYHYNDRTIQRILIPAFGHICVDELTADHVYEWAEDYGKKVTTNTLSNIISPLRVALDLAVIEKKINVNPLNKITLYGLQKGQKIDKHDPFNRDEIHALLLTATGQFANYLRFAIFTGLRPSEQVALTWQDYNPRLRTLTVDKSLTDYDDVPTDTKTAASNRTIHLSPTAIYALDQQKKYTYLTGAEIFNNPFTNKPWNGSRPIRQKFKLICRDAKVRYRKPYQTRHTYASMQLTAGENIAFISEQMGHTDVAFTLQIYASYIQKHRPDAGWKADSEFTDLDIKTTKLLEFA